MKPHVILPLLACAVALLASQGCSLMVDTSIPSGGCFTGNRCGSGGVCRADGTCSLPAAASCTANTECRLEQRGDFCVNGQCIVNPVTEDCPLVLPPNALEEVNSSKLLFGYIGALDFAAGAADDSYGRPPLEGVIHALEEIVASVGIPGVAGGPGRHLAFLACAENGLGGADGVAQHLVEVAQVPAIIGASTSSNTSRAWDYVRTQSTAVLMSPSATSPDITLKSRRDDRALGDPENRLWRTAPSDLVQVELLQSLARDVIGAINPSQAEFDVFYKRDEAGSNLERALDDSGLPTVFNEYVPVSYPENEDDWESPTAYAQRALAEPLPNLIIALGTDEFVRLVLPEIERMWPATAERPWYVLPEGGKSTSLTEYATAHPELELGRRVIGTAPGARQSTFYRDFARRFEGRFDHSPGNLAEFGYDAAYALVYAIARAGAVFPNGMQLAVALNELACKSDGKIEIAVGADGFAAKFQSTADRSTCIDLEGASGQLDFDEDGETRSDIATWCLRPQGAGTTFEPPLDIYLNAVTGLVEGDALDFTNPNWCPPPP